MEILYGNDQIILVLAFYPRGVFFFLGLEFVSNAKIIETALFLCIQPRDWSERVIGDCSEVNDICMCMLLYTFYTVIRKY